MKIRSLRLRLTIAAAAAILSALAIAGIGLVLLFERHVERRIGSELNTYLNQMAARTIFDDDMLKPFINIATTMKKASALLYTVNLLA